MQMLQIQKMIAEVITENRALDAGFLFVMISCLHLCKLLIFSMQSS